jgi:DNA-binding response OmpR family regulator
MKNNHIKSTDKPVNETTQHAANLRILVVDDEPMILQLNSEVLSDAGYDVDSAEDGAAAWDALQLNRYDLLITDHDMPNMSGLELVRKLHAARVTLPVIMASGTMPVEELKRHPWLPIEAKLQKPYTLTELLCAVSNVFSAFEKVPVQFVPMPTWLQPVAVRLHP